jgi:hypothetical protein
MCTANFVPTDSANYNTFLLFQQNFVIGKDTNSYFMVSNSPQTYTGSGQAATVTILQVQYQEQFPIFLPEEQQLKLMQNPLQPTSFLRTS